MTWLKSKAELIKLGLFLFVFALIIGKVIAIRLEISHLKAKVASLESQIDDPITGYRAKLSQCQTNVRTLGSRLTEQNTAISALSKESTSRISAAEKALAAERGKVASLEARGAATLIYRPVGDTTCARVEDIRRNYVEGLK